MKLFALAAMIAASAAPALAQTAPAPAPAPAAPAPAAPAMAPAATTKFNLDTPIETIVADPAAKAALDTVIPNVAAHPSYESFKAMSLTQVAPYSQGMITDDVLARAKVALEAVK